MIARVEIAERLRALAEGLRCPRDPVRPLTELGLVERIGEQAQQLRNAADTLDALAEQVLK